MSNWERILSKTDSEWSFWYRNRSEAFQTKNLKPEQIPETLDTNTWETLWASAVKHKARENCLGITRNISKAVVKWVESVNVITRWRCKGVWKINWNYRKSEVKTHLRDFWLNWWWQGWVCISTAYQYSNIIQ